MYKILMYSLLCILSLSSLSIVTSYFDSDKTQRWAEQIIPSTLRKTLLDYVLKKPEYSLQQPTFIIGTSHVSSGFSHCMGKNIRSFAKPTLDAKHYLRIAKTIMLAISISDLTDAEIILEVSLIDSNNRSTQANGLIQNAFLNENSFLLFLKILRDDLTRFDRNCNPQGNNESHQRLLADSQIKMKYFTSQKLNQLITSYLTDLDKLIQVCDRNKINKLTLVSLPIHADLYAVPQIRSTFETLEKRITQHLNTMVRQQSCEVRYVNLTSFGTEFLDSKYWIDPGHFTPEVGMQVLKKLNKP